MLRLTDRVVRNEYGIRRNHIRSVVANPDSQEVLKPPDESKIFRLYAQEVTAVEPHRYLIVLTEERERDEFAISVYPAPSGIVLGSDPPTEMLRKLAHAFGPTIQVGNSQAKFIVSDEIPFVEGTTEVMKIVDSPEGHEMTGEAMIRKTNGFLQVLLAFGIDATLLKRRLGID